MTATATAGTTARVDLGAIKAKQRVTWGSGNYARVATKVVWPAEVLCESAGLQAGWSVLDVATGSGNAALGAARRGCRVTGVDYTPALLERGRARAEAEMVEIDFREGDAENLPFENNFFDAVLSIFGVMFAPDHAKAARELVRVCKPGGTIALACWPSKGFIGDMFKLFSTYAPPAPGLTPPVRWGDVEYQKGLFGDTVKSFKGNLRTVLFRDASAEANVEFFRTYYGPTLKLFESVGADRGKKLAGELAELARRYDRNGNNGGPVAIEGQYLESVMVKV